MKYTNAYKYMKKNYSKLFIIQGLNRKFIHKFDLTVVAERYENRYKIL